MSELSLNDFKTLKLEDKELFDKHHEKYPPNHSDNLFTTMISWKDYIKYKYTFLDGTLLVLSQIGNKIQFRPPSGKINKDVVDKILSLAKKEGTDPPFGLIDSATKNKLEKIYPKLKFTADRDYFEYVYSSKDLAELSGSDYSKIRNRLNKFQKRNDYTIENISEEDFKEVQTFLHRWCLWKDCESDRILKFEKKAILHSMANFFELKLKGIALRIDGKIESIAVYEPLNKDTVVVHYEKGSPAFDGIYKAINQETAKIVQNDFKYINRESDMGIAGLRRAKKSYRPDHMIKVFHVNKKNLFF